MTLIQDQVTPTKDQIIELTSESQSDNIRTRSGDARVRSHDQTIVRNAEKQPQLPLTASASSTEQQVTSRNDNGEITSRLTSQSESHISQSDSNNQATPTTVAAPAPARFNWEKQVTPVLNAVNSASKSDTEVLCELCTNLWTVLQSSNIIGRSTGKSKQRSSLRAMFQLLVSKESRLLLRATKIILTVSLIFVSNQRPYRQYGLSCTTFPVHTLAYLHIK